MARGKRLTEKELEYIKVNLLIKSVKEIADELGRNYWTIYKVNQELGLSRNHEFTPQEDNYIIKNYKSMPASQIAGKLKISVEMLYNRARKLGVTKPQKKV